jgi:hypothetical protein
MQQAAGGLNSLDVRLPVVQGVILLQQMHWSQGRAC